MQELAAEMLRISASPDLVASFHSWREKGLRPYVPKSPLSGPCQLCIKVREHIKEQLQGAGDEKSNKVRVVQPPHGLQWMERAPPASGDGSIPSDQSFEHLFPKRKLK